MKNSLYRISLVGSFLGNWLRSTTGRRLTGDKSCADDFLVDLAAGGFDLFSAAYALNLALLYIMTLLGQSSVMTIMRALVALPAFIFQLASGLLDVFEEVLKMRC